MAITGYTKDGSIIYSNDDKIPYIDWNATNYNKKVIKSKKLQVQFFIQWISPDYKNFYEAIIVMPNNLNKRLINFQKKYGTNTYIVVGIEKNDPKNKDYIYGQVCFKDKKNKEEIMKFRASKLDIETKEFFVSKYSLPKGFEFPKWEGREKLITPDIEFWQEK